MSFTPTGSQSVTGGQRLIKVLSASGALVPGCSNCKKPAPDHFYWCRFINKAAPLPEAGTNQKSKQPYSSKLPSFPTTVSHYKSDPWEKIDKPDVNDMKCSSGEHHAPNKVAATYQYRNSGRCDECVKTHPLTGDSKRKLLKGILPTP